ncbi:hypothetical protein [Kiloniella sp. EL199]|uniref:hypothetical protein n=1 Tax=Kiloniella sp. EL199 TaxID=2107581 RepID=UPI000EA35983|nr:hypothetical protein [Kiloniella sp. EL199]
MRVTYIINLQKPIQIQDHWPIKILGGDLELISKDSKIIAFKTTFHKQSIELAPTISMNADSIAKCSINASDALKNIVLMQLRKAFYFLQCYFDVNILIDEVESQYEPENKEEAAQLKITSYKKNENNFPTIIPFDLFTRAIMAAERGDSPQLEATFLQIARSTAFEKRYIDSFRYSFLLIETLYGNGKFKSKQLKEQLTEDKNFTEAVKSALQNPYSPHRKTSTNDDKTLKLLVESPSVKTIIEHLVDMRGFYFHGNIKRKDNWQADKQDKAKTLCFFTLDILMAISQKAASLMFNNDFIKKHYENAINVGAIMTMKVEFKHQIPEYGFDETNTLRIKVPGTKPTNKLAVAVLKEFIEQFEHTTPTSELKSANCIVEETGQKVFHIDFHLESKNNA